VGVSLLWTSWSEAQRVWMFLNVGLRGGGSTRLTGWTALQPPKRRVDCEGIASLTQPIYALEAVNILHKLKLLQWNTSCKPDSLIDQTTHIGWVERPVGVGLIWTSWSEAQRVWMFLNVGLRGGGSTRLTGWTAPQPPKRRVDCGGIASLTQPIKSNPPKRRVDCGGTPPLWPNV
jgi:hypothetical protein